VGTGTGSKSPIAPGGRSGLGAPAGPPAADPPGQPALSPSRPTPRWLVVWA